MIIIMQCYTLTFYRVLSMTCVLSMGDAHTYVCNYDIYIYLYTYKYLYIHMNDYDGIHTTYIQEKTTT